MPDLTELDRLIEEGLKMYGQGDLDAALLIWERALGMDPDNPQANSYVDYVRMNYEMLTTDAGQSDSAPFGIGEDEPEYQIEIMPGEVGAAGAPMYMDPTDEGWFMESEIPHPAQGRGPGQPADRISDEMLETQDLEPQPLMLELDADEPPLTEPHTDPSGVSFEDATREYDPRQGAAAAAAEFGSEGTPGFGSPEDVKSFASQLTDVKQRDLGFVKPVRELPLPQPPPDSPVDPDELPAPPPTRARRSSHTAPPPELKMTLRTPAHEEPADGPPATTDVALSDESEPSDELITSLPSPKPSHVTRDMPSAIVPPSAPPTRLSLDSFDVGEPELPPEINIVSFNRQGITRDTGTRDTSTRDFADKPTQELTHRAPAEPDPMISAPTRELGLRPPPGSRALTEDEPTMSKPPLDLTALTMGEGTRSDIVLPFDPIDARTAQILELVDEGAPANEPKDDRTRRRISSLLEHASTWIKDNDLDRAVAAVDLALSEDPSSALAQKLIHRNRDTIMAGFQAFLGDLNRQPALARPLHELSNAPISPRAAFLLSRVDGSLSLDEILDVSGMPRLEAYRYLCQLFLRGILR
ncbi:hypothetical protein BH11MYX3_BH11MYX3_05460 [soil metagenome]